MYSYNSIMHTASVHSPAAHKIKWKHAQTHIWSKKPGTCFTV